MNKVTVVWMLAAYFVAPGAATAADEPATLVRKAEFYAFEAKQYAAAGKPVTDAIAKRYARLSRDYRARAMQAGTER